MPFTIDRRMKLCLRLIVLASLFLVPHLTTAQEAIENPMVIGESGEAYLRAIRLRGIDANVAYFDPDRPPPPMETRQEPKPPVESGTGTRTGNVRIPALLISATVLMAIAYVFVRYGGGFAISFGPAEKEAELRRRGRTQRQVSQASAYPRSLKAILRMQDRREALVQLAQVALTTAVTSNGVLMQRSWTARDALRHLPDDQSCLGALRKLVLASERVHFGGRDISEDEFQVHVEDIRPILSGMS